MPISTTYVLKNMDAEKIRGIWNLFEEKAVQYTGNAGGPEMEAAVKSLGEKLEFELEKKNLPLNFMIFNLQQPFCKRLEGWNDYKEEFIYEKRFGIWIFESGTFENLGIGSYENWRFGGYKGGNWTRGGEPVKLFRIWYWPFVRHEGGGRKITFKKIQL